MTMQLGNVRFEAFEVPPSISFGGAQRLDVHVLAGGGRVVDVLGPDDGDITWAGILSGAQASTRAQLLDAMRRAGQKLLLSWDVFAFTVVIASCVLDYRNPAWIPFRIRCTVVSSPAAAGPAVTSAAQSVLADLATAAGYAALPPVAGAFTAAQANPGPASNAALAAQGQAGLASMDASLAQSGALLDGNGADVADLMVAAQAQATVTAARGYVARALVTQLGEV